MILSYHDISKTDHTKLSVKAKNGIITISIRPTFYPSFSLDEMSHDFTRDMPECHHCMIGRVELYTFFRVDHLVIESIT